MSLLMLKTKNLSWQDHTLNIEAMLAPLRSTLLMNKHKTLDTKFDQEKALYQRQRDACIKDFVVEKRLIERRRQKILNRKRELMQEIRSHSALEHVQDKNHQPSSDGKERSLSAPSNGRIKPDQDPGDVSNITASLPKLSIRQTPLFVGNPLRPKLFLETGQRTMPPPETGNQSNFEPKAVTNIFITGDGQSLGSSSPSTNRQATPKQEGEGHTNSRYKACNIPKTQKTPRTPHLPNTKQNNQTSKTDRANNDRISKRMPSVSFLGLLNNDMDDDDGHDSGRMVVEVKPKTIEDKVRDFLKELDAFNSRPPTAAGDDDDDVASLLSSIRSRELGRQPLVANKYQTLTMDRKLLEKAFDRYIEKRSHDDLLKAMKLAAKMKAHIRQARNTSLIPTMAAMKSSKTFLKLLKRQQRNEKQMHVNR